MRRLPVVLLVLGLSACAKEPPPPALPEEPVILEAFLGRVDTDGQPPVLECQSPEPAWHTTRGGKSRQAQSAPVREVAQVPSVREADMPKPSKPKAVPVDQLIAQATKAALVTPTADGYVGGQAVYRFRYEAGKIYVVPTNPQTFTKLYLPKGEVPATEPTLPGTDESGWKTVKARIGPEGQQQAVLGVRPMEDNLTADVQLEMASGRVYLVRFVPSKTPMLAVTWQLPSEPQEPMMDAQQTPQVAPVSLRSPCVGASPTNGMFMPVDLATLHTGYKVEIKGSPGFVPTQVFDDGRKTMVKLKALAGNAPVVFTYKSDGSRGLVQFAPYSVPNDPSRAVFYVIESIWPVIELAGSEGASVLIRRLSEGIPVAQPWERR